MAIKQKKVETTIHAAVQGAISDLNELGTEMQEAYDGIPDNLRNSDRADTLRDSAELLTGVEEIEVPEAISELAVVTIVPYETRFGRATRRLRCEAACALLSGAVTAAQEWADNNEEHEQLEEVEHFIEAAEAVVAEAEGADFPGHRG